LFSLILPLEILVRIWDCIFASGLEFSLKIIVTLISFVEHKLVNTTDLEEFLNVFQIDFTDEKEILYFRERLVNSAQNILISESSLIHLKSMYEKQQLKNSLTEKTTKPHSNNAQSNDQCLSFFNL